MSKLATSGARHKAAKPARPKKAVASASKSGRSATLSKKAGSKKASVRKKPATKTKTGTRKKATARKKISGKKNVSAKKTTKKKATRKKATSAPKKTTRVGATARQAAPLRKTSRAPKPRRSPALSAPEVGSKTPRGSVTTRASRKPSESEIRAAALRLGIEALRPEQSRVIADAVAGRDVLMIVPTGFGKSACYQIPSMLLDRPVVVVSPLRALLHDQAQKLAKLDVPCVRLDGTLTGKARRDALARVAAGGPLLVMTTPETLENTEVGEALGRAGVALVAVDEAHCLSEWGHDFRPAYLRLGARLQEFGRPPLLALTATATERVRSVIVHSLRMRQERVIASSPHRSNLAFEVLQCRGDERARALVRLALRLRRPGIVYCATRGDVDFVFALLSRFDIPAHRYHGGMTAAERSTTQERFMRNGQRTVMVATNAFGLGIDKPDIRFVLHYQCPASLEQYVQEAGRGGRDGKRANGILLYDAGDRSIHEALLARSRVRPDQLYKLGRALAAWSSEGRTPTLEALALSAELGPRVASALLTKIEEAGLVTHRGDQLVTNVPADTIESSTRSLAGQFETLRTQDGRRLDALADYANSKTCRASFLRGYFGEEDGEPCGLCDVCLGGRARPANFLEPLVAPKPAPKQRPKRGEKRRRRRRPRRRSAREG